MKHKEKVHLKEDPFVDLIHRIVDFASNRRRELLIGAGALVVAVLLVLATLYVLSLSKARENRLFAKAYQIQTDASLPLAQKIAALEKIDYGRGVSGAGKLMLAQMYYQNREIDKAMATLKDMPSSRVRRIDDQRDLLLADLLSASGKHKEALDQLNILLSNEDTEIAKDYVLLKIIQALQASGRGEEAKKSLTQLQTLFPNSAFMAEASQLLGVEDQGNSLY